MLRISRMKKGTWNKVRAFFDVTIEIVIEGNQYDLTLKGFKLVEGVKGLFVGFPSEKSKDGEYHDSIWAGKEIKDAITSLSIAQYTDDEPIKSQSSEAVTEDEDIPF